MRSHVPWSEVVAEYIAWLLPRKIVEKCFFRVMVYGTMGQYGTTDPNDLDVFTALQRWQDYDKEEDPAAGEVE